MTFESKPLDLVLSRPGPGVSVVSRGGSDITVEGDFDDVLMLLSRIRDDGRMVPVASMPVAIPGGGVQVHVQLSPVVVPGGVISPPLRSTADVSWWGAGWSWRTASRVCLVPLGAGAVGGVVVAAVVATRWVIGVAAVHPALAFVFAMVFMVAGAVGVAARSDPGVGCVDFGGPKSAAEVEEDSGDPASRAPLRRRRPPVRRPRWVAPVREQDRRSRPVPVQEAAAPVPGVATDTTEAAPVDIDEDRPVTPARRPVLRRPRWSARPTPQPSRVPVSPVSPSCVPDVPVAGKPEPGQAEQLDSPIIDSPERELDRRQTKVSSDRPRWFPVRPTAPVSGKHMSGPMCSVRVESDKGRSRWSVSSPAAIPEPTPVVEGDRVQEPDTGSDAVAAPTAPVRPAHHRMRFWSDRAVSPRAAMTPAAVMQPVPVAPPDVDEDVDPEPIIAPLDRRSPSWKPIRWRVKEESPKPVLRPAVRHSHTPSPVATPQPVVDPDPIDEPDLAPSPSGRSSLLRWGRARPLSEQAEPAPSPGSRLDPQTRKWVDDLRNPKTSQAFSLFRHNDLITGEESLCATGVWLHEQDPDGWGKGRPHRMYKQMRRQYGGRFVDKVESLNDSRHKLPKIADYIEREYGR